MAINRCVIDASAERVFAILSIPTHYGSFVVGSRHVRSFDPAWPEPGTQFHHSLGMGVTMIRDATTVLQAEPPRRLRMETGMGPFGVSVVEFRMLPDPGGTLLEIEETPKDGLVALPALAFAIDRMMGARNVELLRRLRRLAEAGPVGDAAASRDVDGRG